MLKHYDSLSSFLHTCEEVTNADIKGFYTAGGKTRDEKTEWTDGLSFDMTLEYAAKGDEKRVSAAQAIIDKIDELSLETTSRVWNSSPCGAYPVIPEYLVGEPFCMRLPHTVNSDVSPINIYVATTASASLSAEQINKRGSAILALVLKLQAIRPIDLNVVATLDGQDDGNTVFVVPIESRPLDLSVAAFMLTSSAVDRQLMFKLGYKLNRFDSGWASVYHSRTVPQYIGAQPQDLYIPPSHARDQMLVDPIAWVNDKIKHYAPSED